MANRRHQGGSLVVYSPDGSEIYGEIADAVWDEENGSGDEINHVFSGLISEGMYETFSRLNMGGVENVTYRFTADNEAVSGKGRLLRMEKASAPASALLKVESLTEPA